MDRISACSSYSPLAEAVYRALQAGAVTASEPHVVESTRQIEIGELTIDAIVGQAEEEADLARWRRDDRQQIPWNEVPFAALPPLPQWIDRRGPDPVPPLGWRVRVSRKGSRGPAVCHWTMEVLTR